MATPKRKVSGKASARKIRIYSTKAGTQYVRPSDVLLSDEAKKDISLIRKSFGKDSRHSSDADSAKSATDDSDR